MTPREILEEKKVEEARCAELDRKNEINRAKFEDCDHEAK